ncbi:MAG TPA: hypothetical protein VMW19_21410 [Myxococcota bacterium]|nr:hypothetical protein [Myxococcota bacterium]
MRLLDAVACACVGLSLAACATPDAPRPEERNLLVTLESLSEFGLALPDGYAQHEQLRRERQPDGSLSIEYEFQTPGGDPPFVYSRARIFPSPTGACLSFSADNLGLRFSSLEATDRNDVFSYGERSRFALVESQGQPVGNVFAMCHSRATLLVMFVGIYFDDTESWRALVEPHLQALEAFEAATLAE